LQEKTRRYSWWQSRHFTPGKAVVQVATFQGVVNDLP